MGGIASQDKARSSYSRVAPTGNALGMVVAQWRASIVLEGKAKTYSCLRHCCRTGGRRYSSVSVCRLSQWRRSVLHVGESIDSCAN